ncbi:hypothetical protein X474_07760 [Dethiosulfatarculus sandiegensis]|uniref:Uncharacterized protein n=1 Tax=Dethiosulfatarculus sandiegensis TaxID=1429043 RepID=A0A0D2HW79_9BACT|nr:hypothetical protein X474_07760 [Dethiosulfatarculus sandiegensis]
MFLRTIPPRPHHRPITPIASVDGAGEEEAPAVAGAEVWVEAWAEGGEDHPVGRQPLNIEKAALRHNPRGGLFIRSLFAKPKLRQIYIFIQESE